jgi:hypothetical protein
MPNTGIKVRHVNQRNEPFCSLPASGGDAAELSASGIIALNLLYSTSTSSQSANKKYPAKFSASKY